MEQAQELLRPNAELLSFSDARKADLRRRLEVAHAQYRGGDRSALRRILKLSAALREASAR